MKSSWSFWVQDGRGGTGCGCRIGTKADHDAEVKFLGGQKTQWERVERIGGGGQSEVYLVRTPERTQERALRSDAIKTRVPTSMSALTDAHKSESNTRPGSERLDALVSGMIHEGCARFV
jgi:hypothetical protein